MNLINLRKSCIDRDIPIISKETEYLLGELLNKYKPKNCLEIGSAIGYSSIFISDAIKNRGGFLYSFEISYASYIEGIQNISKYEQRNLTIYPFDFNKVKLKKLIPNKIDFVFIDGQKNQYTNYLINIIDILKPKNILVFDDVIKFKSKISGLYGYLKKNQINYKKIKTEEGDGVIVIENLK